MHNNLKRMTGLAKLLRVYLLGKVGTPPLRAHRATLVRVGLRLFDWAVVFDLLNCCIAEHQRVGAKLDSLARV